MGHVPPARTESKQNWDETCWQKYTLWLKQYRDVVVGSLYGHMNIDHFLLQDEKELTPELGLDQVRTRGTPDESISISSKEDYLQELRDTWTELPKVVTRDFDNEVNEEDDEETELGKKKNKKGKKNKKKKKLGKIGGKYAERYQLSLITPSVVPNYFPTLRIFEYNITGIEDVPVWRDAYDQANPPTALELPDDTLDYENPEEVLIEILKKKHKKDKKKDKSRRPPKDHELAIPLDPPKGSTPGPAYYPQLLTLTGYTQYFANLTHINDDLPDVGVDINKWRKGKHDNKEPKHGKPNPREFQYEVEYSTFDDKHYKLPDLTVKSYLKLAYRMGQREGGSKGKTLDTYEEDEDVESGADEYADNEPDPSFKKGKGDKKNNKKSKKEKNKTWLHFLSHAFVRTVPKEELEKM
ncbi:hypothetical protein Trisim1_006300 [Trichoderma cf. simile WF8]